MELLWTVLYGVSLGIFILTLVFLIVRQYRKNKFYKSFHQDDLFKTDKEGGSNNGYYYTSAETRGYIRRYVIRRNIYEKSLICNYDHEYKEITYFVMCYDFRKKVRDVLEITERNTSKTSKIIPLDERTKFVNIYIKKVDGKEINGRIIRPLTAPKIRLFAFFSSICVFTFLFVLAHTMVYFIAPTHRRQFYNSVIYYIIIGSAFLIALIYFFLVLISYRKKNSKTKEGGTIEYEYF